MPSHPQGLEGLEQQLLASAELCSRKRADPPAEAPPMWVLGPGREGVYTGSGAKCGGERNTHGASAVQFISPHPLQKGRLLLESGNETILKKSLETENMIQQWTILWRH